MIGRIEKGVYGPLVQEMQLKFGLIPDGHYGPATAKVLGDSFQLYDFFNLALNFVGSHEGTLYDGCVGNFDGAGLTAGVIGFNLGVGTMQNLFARFIRVCPEAPKATKIALLKLAALSRREIHQMPKQAAQEHIDLFKNLFQYSEWIAVNKEYAREAYWNIANRHFQHLPLADQTNLFDLNVQTGLLINPTVATQIGLNAAIEKRIRERYTPNSKFLQSILNRRESFKDQKLMQDYGLI